MAEAKQRLISWGLQVELTEEFEEGMSLSCSSIGNSSDLLDQGVLSLEYLDTVDSTLLASSVRMKMHSVSPPNLPTYVELLVMDHTMDKFDLAWWCERRVKIYTSPV